MLSPRLSGGLRALEINSREKRLEEVRVFGRGWGEAGDGMALFKPFKGHHEGDRADVGFFDSKSET